MFSKKLIAIFVIYMIAFVYSLIFAPAIAKIDHGVLGAVNRLHESSVVNCDSCTALTSGRGANYYIASMDEGKFEQLRTSLVTFWGAMHFLLYAILGYVAPDMFWETFAVGVGFECYEYAKYSCEDPLDVVWNSAGFLVGRYLHHHFN